MAQTHYVADFEAEVLAFLRFSPGHASVGAALAKAVTLHYTTANGSALAGSDYLAKTGTLKIKKNKTSAKITIVIKSDKLVEPNETLLVNLSAALNAAILDGQAIGTIINDD